jgi:hypothetical protein
MDAVVPSEITAELTQILSNLVLGDNEIRQKYMHSSWDDCFEADYDSKVQRRQ